MSGIVGIVNLDQAPVDPRLLQRLTDFLAFRGPDGQEAWMDHYVGLGHTALWTTFESEREHQPSSLDGQVWITADARVDGRADLIPQLESQGRTNLAEATDPELILHAYHAWGESCVEHLLGDFAFVIWDGRQQRLFCACDHLGIKPLYYAQVGNTVIVSNTLDCVRQHPAVSDKLNESAIADFLLYGSNQDLTTTTFADVQRLTAAHTAVWSEGRFQLRRYWALPIDEPLVYPRPDDYAERFRELLRTAVRDRLRTSRLGIFMSGGLDSSGLAATACELRRELPDRFSLKAFTVVFDYLMPDQERYYAGLVAKHLNLPIEISARDAEASTPWEGRGVAETPEPVPDPFSLAYECEYQKQIASDCRVFLYGEGPDNALKCDWRAHLNYLAQKRRWGRLLPDLWFHVVGHPRIPFVGRMRNWSQDHGKVRFSAWLNEDFANRFRLRERWGTTPPKLANPHPTRPTSYYYMSPSIWQWFFDSCDLTCSRAASEMLHPYVDLRFLRFLLAVPAIPWCCNKTLSRLALRGWLPDQVVRRPKAPLARDTGLERARRMGMPKFPVTEAVLCYTVPSLFPVNRSENSAEFWADMRGISLAYWLLSLKSKKKLDSSEQTCYTVAKSLRLKEGLLKEARQVRCKPLQ